MKTAVQVGNEMFAAKLDPMTKEQAKTFISLLSMKEDIGDFGDMEEQGLKIPFAARVAEQRLQAAGIPVERRVLIMIAALAETPGVAVLYAAAAKAIYDRTKSLVTLRDFADTEAFGMGFPSDEALHKIWDGQKGQGDEKVDNWLDRKEAWS